MQDKASRDSQRKSVGEINDQRVQQLQDERRAVQRRTFTRWMNVFLLRRDPPVEVHDLFTDVQDGRILMALLEELSGCKLLYRFRSSSHRIFRLNNISQALAFLDDRHVKLLGIDASGIADGIPSVVLNLIWNMILYFQVKEVTAGLQRHLSSSLSSLSMNSYPSSGDLSPQPNDIGSYSCNTLPSKSRRAAREPKYHGKTIKTLLQWVQRSTSKFGVEVHDFGKSWRSGLAFLAMIKSINPALVDLRESLSREPRENIQQAFLIAHHSLDIPRLLEPEDVSCSSPDERSIITYVSMFLGLCSGTEEVNIRDTELPDIPNFGSLESVSFGETLADDPEAQALLQGLEKSSEQLLWKRWGKRSSGSPRTTSLPANEATSPFSRKKSRCRSILEPPSPLDAGVVSQEIRSWMEKASADQGNGKTRMDDTNFSLSSEEGIYCVSALDSDEEDAYSYILDLNKEVFQPYNQMKRQVPRVEEETEEEMFLNGQQTEESRHLEVCETLNGGGKHQEGFQNAESEVGAQFGVHRMFDWDKNESSSRATPNIIAASDMEEDNRSREDCEDERVVHGQRNDDAERKTESARSVKHGSDKREALVDETKNTKLFDGQVSEKRMEDTEEEDKQEERGKQQSVNFTANEKILTEEAAGRSNTEEGNDGKDNAPCEDEDKEDEVMDSMDFEEGKEKEIRRRKLTDKKATTIDHPGQTAPKHDTNGGADVHSGDSWTPACSATPQSLREGGFMLQSAAASCDLTPLELEMLLVLWILLYCFFILPQMNS